MAPLRSVLVAMPFLAALVVSPRAARADDTIKTPGDHPSYKFEIEPHLLFGVENHYGANGYGIGARAAIPIVENGFVPSINNSVAIGFGVDFLHYSYCWYTFGACSANALEFPVVMQWNFYVAQKWSVFGEPGLFFWKGFFGDCGNDPRCNGISAPGGFYVGPALYLGGRYYFSEHVTLTMRIGWPAFSIGVSFM
jgi:hypothetical protein